MRARGLSLGVSGYNYGYRVCLLMCLGLASEFVAGPAQGQSAREIGKLAVTGTSDEKLPDAERIGRLKRTIDADDALLREFKVDLDNPEGPYAMAESEFKYLDGQLAHLKKDHQKLRDDGKHEDAASLQAQIDAVEKNWKLSMDRFSVAIEERKNLVEKITTLEEKLRKDRDEVGRLTGVLDAGAARGDVSAPAKESTSAAVAVTATVGTGSAASQGAQPAPNATASVPGAGSGAGSMATPPGASLLQVTSASTPVASAPAATTPKLFNEQPPSKELVQARDDAKAKEAVAQQALEEATTLSSRIEDLRKLIDQERKSLELAGKKSDLARRTERGLEQELELKLSEGAYWTDLQELRKRIAEANRQDEEALAAARDSAKRLDDIQSELAELHARQLSAMQAAEKRRFEAEAAQKKVEQLENPFAPKNLARWAFKHGPRLGGCVLGMAFLLWLARRIEHRLIAMGVASSERGSTRERENRTRTLVAVFHNSASTAVIITGTVLVLNEVGVNVALLMGGAAVFGLAVAFGAQNLIRDYFYGFVILLENQYKLNDVVRIGTIAGQVERITLRMTVLRDLEGNVHFIPNGQISSVCNKTHGWSRALFDIPVAYKEDVDEVMGLLIEVGKEVQKDPQFASLILEDPTMLGVDSLGDSAVNIKFYIKTKPLQQWTVKREILRRIKKRFHESNVEIPFPHRMVYYRNISNESQETSNPSTRAAA